MYNCYNEAVIYLRDKLGTKEVHHGFVTKEVKQHRIDKTYKDEKIKPNSDEAIIDCLLKQYYFGIDAKKELFYKLQSLGVKTLIN